MMPELLENLQLGQENFTQQVPGNNNNIFFPLLADGFYALQATQASFLLVNI